MGSGTQRFVSQKWPQNFFPFLNFVLPHSIPPPHTHTTLKTRLPRATPPKEGPAQTSRSLWVKKSMFVVPATAKDPPRCGGLATAWGLQPSALSGHPDG